MPGIDRRIGGRGDARPALTVFGPFAADAELFENEACPVTLVDAPLSCLRDMSTQTFSWVYAIVLLCADDDRRVERLWTVDSTLGAYCLAHEVVVSIPGQ